MWKNNLHTNRKTNKQARSYSPKHSFEVISSLTGIKLVNPLPDDKFLDSSKLKEFADDYFKFD